MRDRVADLEGFEGECGEWKICDCEGELRCGDGAGVCHSCYCENVVLGEVVSL